MTRNLIRQVHLWLGLTLCLPLVVIGLTGSILVFEGELHALFGPGSGHRLAGGEKRAVAAIVAAARAVAPGGYVVSSYFAPGPGAPLAAVRLIPGRRGAAPTEGLRVAVDPVSLEAFPEPPSDLLRQVFFLHSTLLMKDRTGRLLVGWFGIAMLAMGASGLVNWWPRRRQWHAAFSVSRNVRGYRLHRELHGATGIWALAVFLVVSLAGVCLAFPDSARSTVALVLPAHDLRAETAAVRVEPVRGGRPLDIDAAIALARATVPDAAPGFVFLPLRPDRPYRIGLLPAGEERGAPQIVVLVDPWTGRVIDILDPHQFSAGETLLAWQHAVHAGRGLGWVWRLSVFAAGLLPLLFAVTGVAMWWSRRHARVPEAAAGTIFD